MISNMFQITPILLLTSANSFLQQETLYISSRLSYWLKMQEDVKLLKEMGMNLYRFSISWSRILPGKLLQYL